MNATDLVLSQADLMELAEAVKVIEKHYPGRELRLVLRHSAQNGDTKRDLTTPPKSNKERGRAAGNRAKVAKAATGRWVTLAQLIDATGLKKYQVHGAMLAKDGPYTYERRLVDEAMPNGPKEYRLKGT